MAIRRAAEVMSGVEARLEATTIEGGAVHALFDAAALRGKFDQIMANSQAAPAG